MIVTALVGQSEMLTDYSNVSIKRRINEDYNLNFSIIPTKHNQHSYRLIQDDAAIKINDETFIVKNLSDDPYGKVVTAEHCFFDCLDDFVEEIYPDGLYTINEALELAFSTSDWTYAIEGMYLQATLYDFGNDNAVALLNLIVGAWGIEYDVSSANKTIYIKKRLGVQTDFQIRYKHNLKTISKSINSEKVKTSVKVYYNLDEYGNYNSSVIYESPRAANYPKPKWAEPIYLEDVTTQAAALEYAKKNLKDVPDISFVVEFTELQKAGYASDDVQLGNSIYLIDERMLLNGTARIVDIEEFPYDKTRAPIITVTNVTKSITDTIVQQKIEQRQLAKTAVKQKTIYNGCTISPEDGFKATAENGVITFLNATEGIAIIKDTVYKFYVNPEGELILDGKLQITTNGITLLEAYMDEAGGTLKIYDDGGALNAAIGSNKYASTTVGGAVFVYYDGESLSDIRGELSIDKDNESGQLELRDRNGAMRLKITASDDGLAGIRIRNESGETVTRYEEDGARIMGQDVITEDVMAAHLDALEERMTTYINDWADWLIDYVDDSIPSGE